MCAYARSPQVILFKVISSAQTSFRTWVGSRQFKPLLIVQLNVFNLSILDQSISFWSFILETIISFYLSIRLIRWFLNLMPPHSSSSEWVPILTSAPLWIARSFVEILSDSVLRIQKPREVLSLMHNTFGKLSPLLWQPCSPLELVIFTFETCGLCY